MPAKPLPRIRVVKDGKVIGEKPAGTTPPPAPAKPWITAKGVVSTLDFGAMCAFASITTNPLVFLGLTVAFIVTSGAALAGWDYFKERKQKDNV